jgi:glycosyltransferase involved in cell wall biosynthesis
MNTKIVIIENNIIAVNSIREKLIRTLMEKGYDVTVLTSGNPEQMRFAREKGFNVVDVGGSTQNPLHILIYLFNLHRAMAQCGADICLTFTVRPAIWGNIVTRALKIPTVTNITGIGPLFERNDIAYRGARTLYKFALRKTARIFFKNHDDMDIFIEKGFIDPGMAERIPGSGIDHEYYLPRERGDRKGKFNFIFISRLVKDKGIREYIDSARMLKAQLPDVAFNVLGPVWKQNLKSNTISRAEIEEWVEEGTINYFGESGDVREHIAGSDCVVLPSYREGLSNILLEASSMGRPCITGNVTGCKEVVEDGITGYLCRVRDADDLAGKMKMMYNLSEEKRVQMGKNAREKVVREFDKKIVIDAYLKAIERIING